jgi:tetratricopeptide (TPR) repeat protein
VLLFLAILLAPVGHRANAEHAEALGRLQEAAREYEAAWEEEQAPELLYRLGLSRRKLKEYGKAREAFRGYLRVAPEGGLRAEVERQLTKLQVLIEAQAEDYRDEPNAPVPAIEAHTTAAPVVTVVQLSPLPAADVPPPVVQRAALLAVTETPPLAWHPIEPRRPRYAPWLVAGGTAALLAGAGFWWDGSRVASDLDARFARGDLTAADRPRYGRADRESIAGRVLVVAGVGLIAGAAALWR